MPDYSAPSSVADSRLVIHFTHLRPYHLARLGSAEDAFAGSGTSVQGIALFDSTGPLPSDLLISRPTAAPIILFPEDESSRPVSSGCICREVTRTLDQLRPTAVAICGYATPDARACLRWCRRNKVKAILMTETRECDGPRAWWKEWIKSRIVRSFDAALCGGPEARAYLQKLGMKPGQIAEGYDVVDNGYFVEKTEDFKTQDARGDGEEQGTGDGSQAQGTLSIDQAPCFAPGATKGRQSTKHGAEPRAQSTSRIGPPAAKSSDLPPSSGWFRDPAPAAVLYNCRDARVGLVPYSQLL